MGPYLENCLKESGHEVFGFERTFKGGTENIYYGDILNFSDVEHAVFEVLPDAVIHLAGFSSVKKSFEEPDLCHKINVEGTKNLFETCVKLPKKPKVIVISSAEVYGKPEFVPITEEHPLKPLSPYGESRVAQENLARKYFDRLEIVILRSFNHTGPGQQPIFVVGDFVKQIKEIEAFNKEPILFAGNIDAIRDLMDVRDVVKAYSQSIIKAKACETYNICSGRGYKIGDILDMLISLSGLNIEVVQDRIRLRPSDIPVLIGSNKKFNIDTEFMPELSFEQTLKDMLDFARLNSN